MDSNNVFDLVIIGSGISGLTAGLKARERKLNFKILAGEEVGGKLQSFMDQNIIIERAANVLVKKKALEDLINILNLQESVAYPRVNKFKQAVMLDNKIIPFTLFSLLVLIIKEGCFGNLKNLFRPVNAILSKKITVHELTEKLFASPKVSRFISGIFRGTYGVESKRLTLSLAAPLFYKHLLSGKLPISYLFLKKRPQIFSFKEGNRQLIVSLLGKVEKFMIHENCVDIKKKPDYFEIYADSNTFKAKKILLATDRLAGFLKNLCPNLADLISKHPRTTLSVIHLFDSPGLIEKDCLGILSANISPGGFIGILQPGAAFSHMSSINATLYNIFYLGDKSSFSFESILQELKENEKLSLSGKAKIIDISVWKDVFPEYSPELLPIIEEINSIEQSNNKIKFACFSDGKGLGVSDRIEKVWDEC